MARHPPTSPSSLKTASVNRKKTMSYSSTRTILYSISLLTLASTISPLSRLQLIPIYGDQDISSSYPSLHFSTYVFSTITCPLICHEQLPSITPLLALGLPIIQHSPLLRRLSVEKLGIENTPLLSEFLTSIPLISLLLFHAFRTLQSCDLFAKRSDALKQGFLPMIGFAYYLTAQMAFTAFLPLHFVNGHFLTSRASLYWGVCVLLSLHFPWRNILLGLSIASIVFMVSPSSALSSRVVTSLPTEFGLKYANLALQPHGWRILERGEGVTGYVSVLENMEMDYRVLRCDHSLLGGEWLLTEDRRVKEGWTKEEPVFGVFEMLEAVRLVEGVKRTNEDERALVIGLGIGTAPKALLSHGIPTTIVELDPLIHAYATKYFSLSTNHTAILSDAVPWVTSTAAAALTSSHSQSISNRASQSQSYTYILHDVFTGGFTPLALFTHSFLSSLRNLLHPSGGVIALNFAGDLTLPPMRNVLFTINSVFQGQCRAFRDMPPPPPSTSASTQQPAQGQKANDQGDMLNLVIFCVNTAAMWPLTFRQPVEADFLGSTSRRRFLLPKKELEVPLPTPAEDLEYIEEGHLTRWRLSQVQAARRHWRLMREAVPAVVWETW